jgi:hypothetical protein
MAMTWKGWLIEESLENRNILDELRIIKSTVEENDEAGKRIWRLHTIEVKDNDIGAVAKKLEKLLKFGYYIHFTDYKNLLIIFRGKSFRIKLISVIKETEFGATEFKADPNDMKLWQSAFDYGTTEGKVDSRYIIKVI